MPLKKWAGLASSYLGLPRLFSGSPDNAITTLLYHRFVCPESSLASSRERLKRELDWLRSNDFTPLNVSSAVACLIEGKLPKKPLVITADDAFVDLLDMSDIFQDFEIPLTVYVCAGWTNNSSCCQRGATYFILQVVDFLRWYVGAEMMFEITGSFTLCVNKHFKNKNIDKVLQLYYAGEHEFIFEIWKRLLKKAVQPSERCICDWSELRELKGQGVTFGSHSVTHCRLAGKSEIRLDFEIRESKSIIKDQLGACESFAYPHGTADVWNSLTTEKLQSAGYVGGFLTHPGFARNVDEAFCLPRMIIPDQVISLEEYKAFVSGAMIPAYVMKNKINHYIKRC